MGQGEQRVLGDVAERRAQQRRQAQIVAGGHRHLDQRQQVLDRQFLRQAQPV
jgi:hypothetical protein